MEENEFAPCRFGESKPGKYTLLFSDFDSTASIFEEIGQDGGGYSWHGVVDALVEIRLPKLRRKVKYDPEASELVILSKDKEILKQVAALIREAMGKPDLLREAIANADPDLMD